MEAKTLYPAREETKFIPYRVFIDLDGVVANWERSAIKLLGFKEELVVPEIVKGKKLEELFPQINQLIEDEGIDFWLGLEPFYWTQKLFEEMKRYGKVAILSSGGNIHRNPKRVANANCGKSYWVNKHLPETPLILTREKHLCAQRNSILIDDNYEKVRDFVKYGGAAFHWPHWSLIESGKKDLTTLLFQIHQTINF